MKHIPVLLSEVIEAVSPKDGETYIDATFGAGGYSRAILESANCNIIAFDRDPNVLQDANKMILEFDNRFKFIAARFSEMENLLKAEFGDRKFDGLIMDIGISSMQIDQADRGFSFKKDGALDMRMSCEGLSASDIINIYSPEEIADIIYKYGEERDSRHIAAAIKKAREIEPITTTARLASIIASVKRFDGKDPATKTFQGLRIFINNELDELKSALKSSTNILAKDGRLVVVSFHSLEDKIVKNFMQENSKKPNASRYLPKIEQDIFAFNIPYKKATKPHKDEIKNNHRSRSARLRYAIRTEDIL